MKIHSDEAWAIASQYSYTLASDTRTLAAQIDGLVASKVAEQKEKDIGEVEVSMIVDHWLNTETNNPGREPRLLDLCFSVFNFVRSGKNPEDGGPNDWFTDTKPFAAKLIDQLGERIKEARGE